jgi:hypothetical protein
MTISKENKEFIDSLIDYYISESEAYRQIADHYWLCIFRIFTGISKPTTNTQFGGYARIQPDNKRKGSPHQKIHTGSP